MMNYDKDPWWIKVAEVLAAVVYGILGAVVLFLWLSH
jgi:hypothetical protein